MAIHHTVSASASVQSSGLLSRRALLSGVGSGAALALGGCTSLSPVRYVPECQAPNPNHALVVDMHCHIMNAHDADRTAFLGRTVSDWGPIGELAEDTVGLIGRIFAWPLAFPFMERARVERHDLLQDLARLTDATPDQFTDVFCKMAAENQNGILFAGKDHQTTGFLSNRLRNAARLMELYPDVDLFLPSIVDFYEGDPAEYSSVIEQTILYSAISIASRGRLLPIAGYHPGRSYVPGMDPDQARESFEARYQLKFLEFAIEHLGCVGVKVHPSTGYSPHNNKTHGCPAEAFDETAEGRRKAAQFDNAMQDLFGLCRRLDVPVLTHNSMGIPAFADCMDRDRRNTNAPSQWRQAIDLANQNRWDYQGRAIPEDQPLRLCLAHFADGFERAGERNDSPLKPTPWLDEALALMTEYDAVYLDLSYQTAWLTADGGSIKDEYGEAFEAFVSQGRGPDWFAGRIMYGSDWHMPSSPVIGRGYLPALQSLMTQAFGSAADRVMGGNAAQFYKLGREHKAVDGATETTRDRIDAFLAEHGIAADDDQVGWRKKADRPAPTAHPHPRSPGIITRHNQDYA